MNEGQIERLLEILSGIRDELKRSNTEPSKQMEEWLEMMRPMAQRLTLLWKEREERLVAFEQKNMPRQ